MGERSKLRKLEIKSINEAIAILNSDDAKDTMDKSFKSQGYLLFQKSAKGVRTRRAIEVIRQAGTISKDTRLVHLVMRVMQQKGHFDEVIEAIDKMVEDLKEEESEDLDKKETCEIDREDNTKDA